MKNWNIKKNWKEFFKTIKTNKILSLSNRNLTYLSLNWALKCCTSQKTSVLSKKKLGNAEVAFTISIFQFLIKIATDLVWAWFIQIFRDDSIL